MDTEFYHEPVGDASGIAIEVPIEDMDGYAMTPKIHVVPNAQRLYQNVHK